MDEDRLNLKEADDFIFDARLENEYFVLIEAIISCYRSRYDKFTGASLDDLDGTLMLTVQTKYRLEINLNIVYSKLQFEKY